MTTEPVAPETLHPWAIYLRASEEARRRGDHRTGSDHILLALLEDPSIERAQGVSVQQARQGSAHSTKRRWAPWAWDPGVTLPTYPCAPCPRSRPSEP